MYCERCGFQLPDDAKFCERCGNVVKYLSVSDNNELQGILIEKKIHRTDADDKKPKSRKRKYLIIVIIVMALGLIAGIAILTKMFLFSSDGEKKIDIENKMISEEELPQMEEGDFFETYESEVEEEENDEILEQSTKEHTYEFFIKDCTWEEAYEFCVSRGGSLATIDTQEEYDELLKNAYFSEHTEMVFYIGGKRNTLEDSYYWIDKNKLQYGNSLNNEDSWCKNIWFNGEPSYSYMEREELYMSLSYQTDIARWGFNDIEDNLISRSSYYSGKIGFICEYDTAEIIQQQVVDSGQIDVIQEPEYEICQVVHCNEYITLRDIPSTSGKEICKIPLGANVHYVENAQNGFVKIMYNDQTGYSLASYLNFTKTEGSIFMKVYNCQKSITLRKIPNKAAEEFCQIPLEAKVIFREKAENGFCMISYDGYTGYVLSEYLTEW